MKKTRFITGSILAAALLVAAAPGNSEAGVQIHIGFPLPVPGFLPPPPPPPLIVPKPPRLVALPGRDVYCHPGDRDALYYRGSWYRPRGQAWFRAAAYDGPWSFIAKHRVPRSVLIVPAGYYLDRDAYGDYDQHHRHDKKHGKRWRHHDRHDRHDRHGRWNDDRRSRHDRWD